MATSGPVATMRFAIPRTAGILQRGKGCDAWCHPQQGARLDRHQAPIPTLLPTRVKEINPLRNCRRPCDWPARDVRAPRGRLGSRDRGWHRCRSYGDEQSVGRTRVRFSGGTLQSLTRCSSDALSINLSFSVLAGTDTALSSAAAGCTAQNVRPASKKISPVGYIAHPCPIVCQLATKSDLTHFSL
jgi:hypothetical protein